MPGTYLAVLDAMRGERYVAPYAKRADGTITVAGPMARVTAAEAAEVAARTGAVALGAGVIMSLKPKLHPFVILFAGAGIFIVAEIAGYQL